MKTGKTTDSLEYITNSQAQGSNDRAFSRTNMSQHHQASKTSISSSNSNRLCIISESFSITTTNQPTNFSSSLEVFIEEMRRWKSSRIEV